MILQQPSKDTGDNSFDIISLNFADSKLPEMVKSAANPYVSFGTQNDYPDYIMGLYRKSAKHQSIINGKVTYIFGSGLKPENENPLADEFLKKANEKQAWNILAKIMALDIENNGGVYLQVIPKMSGIGYNWYHLPFKRVRVDETETTFFYKKDWKKYSEVAQKFPVFKPGIKEASVFCFKEFNPDGDVYPLPSWVSCCNWVESDIEVSKHTLTNAKTGFSASKFINFYDGEPNEAKKRSLTKRLENAATGAEGKRLLIGYNDDPNKKPTVDDLGASDLTKEDFSQVDNLISNNIYAGHGINNAALFGVPSPSHSLGGNAGAELKISYDIFKQTYSNAKQRQLESIINYIASIEGVNEKFVLIDVEPIGIQLTDLMITDSLSKREKRELLGYAEDTTVTSNQVVSDAINSLSPLVANKVLESMSPNEIRGLAGLAAKIDGEAIANPTGAAVTPQQQGANSILTNLSGRQQQQVNRIVRQFDKGQLNKEQAALMLKNGFGFTDEDVNAYLGLDADPTTKDAKFSQDYNEIDVALMFAERGESRENFHVIKSKSFSEDDEEFSFAFKTAEELKTVEQKILKILSEAPATTAIVIGELLKISIQEVNAILAKMEAEGILTGVSKGVRKILKPPTKNILPELLVRYSYEKRPEASGPELLKTSRPFCVKMVHLDKLYSRKEIQQISEMLGYSVFKRSGGFWNHNGIADKQCRHEFRSQIVIRKK